MNNIRKIRIDHDLTNYELAKKINVNASTIDAWENETSEPSLTNLRDLASVLNCSIDDLVSINQSSNNFDIPLNKDESNSFIKSKNDYLNSNINSTRSSKPTNKNIKVSNCSSSNLKRRINSFIWPTILFIIFLLVGISNFKSGDSSIGWTAIIIGIFTYCFVATMILDNTFIPEIWLEITSWGFIRLPGIIFEFSLDGLIFLLAMKVLFFLIGLAIALLAVGFATFIAMILSVFVYPFALIKNIKGEE